MPNVDRRNQRKTLQQQHQWRGERAHQRKAIRRPHEHINQRHRPSDKNENLKQVCDWTAAQLMAADRQESCLKDKAQSDREEIESDRVKHSPSQLAHTVYNRSEKTDCRSNEKIAVHWDNLF